MNAVRAAVGSSVWLGDLVRHDCDVNISISCALDDTPAKVRKESLSIRREKVKSVEPPCRGLSNDVLRECATDALMVVGWGDENAGQPRRVLWPRVHLVMDEHSGAE